MGQKVINIKDGRRLGFVQDVCADLQSISSSKIIILILFLKDVKSKETILLKIIKKGQAM